MEGFLRYEFGRFIFGGAYAWRGLFSELYGMSGFISVDCMLVTYIIIKSSYLLIYLLTCLARRLFLKQRHSV